MSASEIPSDLKTFNDFWPYYVREHSHPVSRGLHVAGTLLAVTILIFAAAFRVWPGMLAVPLVGYGGAWVGHFFFEKNRPATFKYPLYSLAGDFYMLFKTLNGSMPGELKKYARLTEPARGSGKTPV